MPEVETEPVEWLCLSVDADTEETLNTYPQKMKTDYPVSASYRTLTYTLYRPHTGGWFYTFPFEWVWYHSNQGFATIAAATLAAHKHIDVILG